MTPSCAPTPFPKKSLLPPNRRARRFARGFVYGHDLVCMFVFLRTHGCRMVIRPLNDPLGSKSEKHRLLGVSIPQYIWIDAAAAAQAMIESSPFAVFLAWLFAASPQSMLFVMLLRARMPCV